MRPVEVGEIIVERRFHLLDQPDADVRLRIGRPQPTEDPHEWYCPYQFVGVGDGIVRAGRGVDGLQALQLVVTRAVPAWLGALLKEHPSLRWEDAEHGDFGL